MKLDGVAHTVIGVMPERFAYPEYAEVWTPLGLRPGDHRGLRRLDAVARLRDGAGLAQAQASWTR